MRTSLLFILTLFLTSCSSTEVQQINADETTSSEIHQSIIISDPPSSFDVGPVYVNELSVIETDSELLLKITGQLPESCSELYELEFTIEDTHIAISLSSWRPTDLLCMQVLVDFEYAISEMNPTVLKNLQTWVANDNSGKF